MKKMILAIVLCCVSIATLRAQDDLKVAVEKDKNPHIYIDGKQYDYSIYDLLDHIEIATVNVIKDEKALKEYNAPNGVFLFTTKRASQQTTTADTQGLQFKSSYTDPMVIIDGEVSDDAALRMLSPNAIESINVLKGQTAIDLYKAPNGVLLVKTKD